MSEPKLISPLLDGFVMGAPISSHHGVRCCPAMKQDSENKYIVKIISVPASQVQLEALLLTGAYKGPGDAMDYFKEVTDGIVREAELLSKVARLEGFLAYEGWQVVPMEDNHLGYQVYLIGSYKRSLDKYIRRNPLTHLEAVNLGMDICAALAAARRSGYVYIDLKPTNIFLSDDREFRIGDIGFVAEDSVKFTSLPVKYRSSYSAPETLDAMNTLNGTVDTYALGMILYQIFNNGNLPDAPENPEEEFLPAANAGEELSAILSKALAPDPKDRWANPEEMGKALGAYLQSEEVKDVPIVPQTAVSDSDTASEDPDPKEDPHTGDTQVFSAVAVAAQATKDADTKVLPTQEIRTAVSADTQVVPTAQVSASVSGDTQVIPSVRDASSFSGDTQVVPTTQVAEVVSGETKVIPTIPATDSAPVAVADKPVETPENTPKAPRRKPPKRERIRKKPKTKKWIITLIVLLFLGVLGYCGLYLYQNFYLQTIDSLAIDGQYDRLTVKVDTEMDEALLSVTCTDTYGNSMRQPIVNGQAEFLELLPNSQYKINLEVEGYHKLVGQTSDVFNTDSRTEIVSFSGITGPESGSALLTFTVDGPEPEQWILTYTAEGEAPIAVAFTGHSITVKDLVVSKTYTFTLTPSTEMFLTGQTSLDFTASALIMAQNLKVSSFDNGVMTIRWDTPDNQAVKDWAVRIYNDNGFDKTQFTIDNEIVFEDVDPAYSYYIEVTANDMTQPARATITANPITITDFQVSEEDKEKLTVTWGHSGNAPEGGWLLMYSLDGSMTQSVVKCEGTTAVITPRLHGAQYNFTIQAADSTSIFDNIRTYNCPDAAKYMEHSFDAAKTTAYLLPTPEKENWTNGDVSKEDYTDQFSVGEKISVLLFCDSRFFIPDDEISILYVIRNSNGDVLVKYISQAEANWHDLWVAHSSNYAELDLSTIPQELGNYTISIYFNNLFVASADFSIVE